MPPCGFLVASCSSTEFHTVPQTPASKITNSPSMPDMNDTSLHEVIGSILASCGPSSSNASQKYFALGQKFRSPIPLALTVLKAQLLELKRRIYVVEDENGSLRLANTALQSKMASLSGDLSLLRTEYNVLVCDRKKLTLAAEQDQQRIRALTSDIDNAQQFIMAMVDVKLHENFLHVAANDTLGSGEDAEESLAKAIAQEADREGSLWSRILSFAIDIHSTNSYSAAIDLALQTKVMDDAMVQTSGVGHKIADMLPPLPGLHSLSHVASEGSRKSTSDPFCSAHDQNSASSRSKPRPRPPTPFSGKQSSTPSTLRPSSKSNANSNPTKVSGQLTKMSLVRQRLSPKLETVKLQPGRKKTETIECPETQKQNHSEKRKGIIITNGVAVTSTSNEVGVKEKATVFTALTSLERICALLSSSDLGSLEESSDEEESRASDDSGTSLDVDKDLTKTSAVRSGDDREEESGTPCLPDGETAVERSQIPDCPDVLASVSSSPPSTPLGSASSFFSERVQDADASPTLTEFSDITLIVEQEPTAYEDGASICSSLNVSKFPMASGFAKRLSRVVKAEDSDAKTVSAAGTFNGSLLLGNIRSGSPTSTITRLKNSLSSKASNTKPSTVVLPARQKLSSKSSTPLKTGTGKTAPFDIPRASEAAANSRSAKRTKGVRVPRPEAEVLPAVNPPQQSKLSVGRNFLRRLSNISGSVSRPRFSSTSSESSQSPDAGTDRTPLTSLSPSTQPSTKPLARSPTADETSPKPKASVPKAPALTTANGTSVSTRANISTVPRRTKPRSNTVNDFSPVKPSPLSRNVFTSSPGSRDSRSSSKRQSVQVVISTHAPTTQAARTSDADKTAPPAAPLPRPAERRPSVKRQGVKNGECNPPAATPTAAFMKPVNKSATKVAKRMTNSIKPLIPTWTAGPSSSPQCGNMFRNSLSMNVR